MLVDGRWRPTFPNARYLFGRVEFEHWRQQTDNAHMLPVFADSVAPIVEAGLHELENSISSCHRKFLSCRRRGIRRGTCR